MRAARLAVGMTLVACAAFATSYTVQPDGSGDFPTLQAAINACEPGDSVLAGPGTFTGAENTVLDFLGKDLVLTGSGIDVTILDCLDQGYPVVKFVSGETRAAVLRDMTLRNNYRQYESPGIQIDGASPTLSNLHLDDMRGASGDEVWNYYTGAAIHCEHGSPLVSDVSVSNCRGAGSIYVRYGAPIFLSVDVSDGSNGYARGGGFYLGNTNAVLHDVTVVDCSSFEGGGGGVACSGSPSPSFAGCRFENNTADSEIGGGIGGGGLACFGSSPTLRDCVFIDNYGRDGGGALACLDGSAPQLQGVFFAGNSSDEQGSAIMISGSSPSLLGVTVVDSQGSSWGTAVAAVCCQGGSSPQIERSVVAFSADCCGIWADATSMIGLECCDIFGNENGPFGGSIPDLLGVDGNFAIDPLFCRDLGEQPFTLASASPCLPANNDCGVLIGAFGQGCELEAYWISGRVSHQSGEPIPGVLLDGLPGYIRTDVAGEYATLVPAAEPLVVRPLLIGYSFEPVERVYNPLDHDYADQDYVAAAVHLVNVPGNYTDIATAIEFVESGDTILVAPGVYSGPGFNNLRFGGKDIVLMSSLGPELTVIEETGGESIILFEAGETRASRLQGFTLRHVDPFTMNDSAIRIYNAAPTLENLVVIGFGDYSGAAIYAFGPQVDPLVRNSVFARNRALHGEGGAIHFAQGHLTLEGVTVARNFAYRNGGGIWLSFGATLNLTHCLIAFNEGGGIATDGSATINLDCNDLYGNVGGDLVGLLEEPPGLATTFSADPIFCAPLEDLYTLHETSPCAPANSPCGVLVGALGPACSYPVVAIAGVVIDNLGLPLAGTLLSGLPLPCLSDSLGVYRAVVSAGFSGTLRPLLRGFGFTPRLREYADLDSDQSGQDYLGFEESTHRVPAHYPQIQTALDICADGDTVLLAPGLYTGTGNTALDIDPVNLVLRSEAGAAATILDGEGARQGISVYGGDIDSSTVIEGITLRNCVPEFLGGALYLRYSSPTLRHLIIENCSSNYEGGAVSTDGSSLLIEDVVFRSNTAGQEGGALYLFTCSATIRNCLFVDNHGYYGGAIFSYEGGSDPAEVLVEHCTFVGNCAEGKGGVLYTYAGEDIGWGHMPRLRANIFAGNSAEEGGVVYARWEVSDSTRIECNDFFGNLPSDCAGGLGDQVGATGNIGEDPLFCNPSVGDFFLAANSPCLPNANDCQLLMGAFGEGCTAVSVDDGELPAFFALAPAHPNPFNPQTEITFDLPEAVSVELAIYNVAGRLMVGLLDRVPYSAGRHQVVWTGRDAGGRRLASGVYLLRLRAGANQAQEKLVLLK